MFRRIFFISILALTTLSATEETSWEFFDCTGSKAPISRTTFNTSAPISRTTFRTIPVRGYLGQTVGRGLGYKRGYTSIGLFASRYSPRVRPFIDLRGHIFSHRKYAYNLGGGVRFFIPALNRTFGINSYYDVRRAKRDYHQVGVGFEILGPCYDLRLNGYFPIGRHTHETHPSVFRFPGGFVAICRKKQHALRGFDGEIGTSLAKLCPCWCRCWDIYLAVGAYGYPVDCGKNANGARVRLAVNFMDCFTAELRVTDDRYFGTRVQGFFAFSLPLYICEKTFCTNDCCDVCLQSIADIPVQRNEIIVTDRERCSWKTNF